MSVVILGGVMEKVWAWVVDNKEWVFSGVGVGLIGVVWQLLSSKGGGKRQSIKSGSGCNNTQNMN